MKPHPRTLVLAAVALAALATSPAPQVTWAEVEPLVRARFALVQEEKGWSWTSEAPLPATGMSEGARAAIEDATTLKHSIGRALLRRCSIAIVAAMSEGARLASNAGTEAGSARFRAVVFEDARTARIIRNTVAKSLEAH